MSKKKLILAVDDDASVCEFYETGLSTLGYDVTCASTAAKAKVSLASKRPDLILMDIMMPEQDGISLTRELRNDPKTGDIPIIVVSGLADAGTLNDALLFGAVDYVVKPIDLEALGSKLERTFTALERRKKA
jgi:CheY-like chemotaxis protein